MTETINRANPEKPDKAFKPKKLTWKVLVLFILVTAVTSYGVAWRIVKRPYNNTYKANGLLIQGRLEDALELFEEALDSNPRITLAWSGRGLCLIYLGRYEEAQDSYDRALALKPGMALAWKGMGLSHEKLGQPGEALRCYEQALTITPNDGSIRKLKKDLEEHIQQQKRQKGNE